jgi:hypothetical protein
MPHDSTPLRSPGCPSGPRAASRVRVHPRPDPLRVCMTRCYMFLRLLYTNLLYIIIDYKLGREGDWKSGPRLASQEQD